MCQTHKYKKYKYANTQIRHMAKCQKDPTCGIFLKRGLSKGIKNDTPLCQMRKYINTNTQIQHMMKCQKDPACGIFLKRGLFKAIKNDISVCQTIQNTNTKYTNTAYNEVPETPNIWHIFEKRIIQGYHK